MTLIFRTLAAAAGVLLIGAAGAAGIPKVALSEQHRAACKVGVGDDLPELDLRTPNGDPQSLTPLFGKQATVVVFCQAGRAASPGWMTRTLLRDLAPDIAEPMGERGVSTIAIGIGGVAQAGPGCLSLVDRNGEAFAQIGEGRLPRVFVVDAKGKILWFDIEYSQTTRRELRQTLATVLGDGPQAVAEAPREAR